MDGVMKKEKKKIGLSSPCVSRRVFLRASRKKDPAEKK